MGDSGVMPEIFKNESKFYQDADDYWSQVEPTVNGMLGGFGNISNIDIQGSELFLKKLLNLKDKPGQKRALDCGAGIGRITKNLLCKYFDKVDLVEQNEKFVEASKRFLSFEKNIGTYYHSGLQNFEPVDNLYDVIWCQWVLGHLTDDHLVKFLRRCSKGLKRNGVIIIKENISTSEVIVDEDDSSVTRTEELYMELFKNADLKIVRHCKQPNFPKELYVVKIFALKQCAKPITNNYRDTKQNCATAQGGTSNTDSENIINEMNYVNIKDETEDK
ncbi:UNVERIFIED_CONTAM: hypothetical protein PYX00_006693 [Menopon gallinae]|uniref:Alpha N-terminal protein methyltransferase 1 n=1 Tax=Menopon gallinae TaxID=328185 RepID=A0AAW2HXA7_9NEOP